MHPVGTLHGCVFKPQAVDYIKPRPPVTEWRQRCGMKCNHVNQSTQPHHDSQCYWHPLINSCHGALRALSQQRGSMPQMAARCPSAPRHPQHCWQQLDESGLSLSHGTATATSHPKRCEPWLSALCQHHMLQPSATVVYRQVPLPRCSSADAQHARCLVAGSHDVMLAPCRATATESDYKSEAVG